MKYAIRICLLGSLCWAAACSEKSDDGAFGSGGGFTTTANDSGLPVAVGSQDAGSGAPNAGASTAGPTTGEKSDAGGARSDSGTTSAEGGGPSSSATSDAAAAATLDSGSAGPSSFDTCKASLTPKCSYEDKEKPCSSLMTASIPLSNGGSWGNVEIQGGPYGAFVEWNEGKAFANPVNFLEDACDLVAGTFGEPESVTRDVLNLRGADLSLYTVFRPACMKDGEKYPVITWGNGTCGQTGGYGSLLAALASYGYVVIASNSRYTDAGNNEMLKALDFAKAANEDMSSALFHRLDLDKVGAMGHSQGSSATAHAASDARIKAVILWNAGSSAPKPFLAVSGDRDIAGGSAADLAAGVNAATQPGAWLFFHKVLETGGNFTGHLTLMMQPERVVGLTVAWWDYMLRGSAEAKKMFVGNDCGLCNKKDDYEYGQKGLP